MPKSEESRKAFIKGYNAGWKQCIKFLSYFPIISGDITDKLHHMMEITEKNFVPKPFKDDERKLGNDAYSSDGSSE